MKFEKPSRFFKMFSDSLYVGFYVRYETVELKFPMIPFSINQFMLFISLHKINENYIIIIYI